MIKTKSFVSFVFIICLLMSMCCCSFAQSDTVYSDSVPDCSEWCSIVQIELCDDYIIGLKKDGSVVTCGNVPQWAKDIGAWEDIIQIEGSPSGTFIAGLKSDGKIVISCTNDPCYGDFPKAEVESWTAISKISVGYYNSLSGLNYSYDGMLNEVGQEQWNTASYYGYNHAKDICYGGSWLSVLDMNNFATIFYDGFVGKTYTDVAEVTGSMSPVILHTDGTIELSDTLTENCICSSWKNINHIATEDDGILACIAAIDENGTLLLNDIAVSRFGDLKLSGAVAIDMNSSTLAVLMKDGSVNLYPAVDDNTCQDDISDCECWNNIVEIAGTDSFIAGLKSDGTVELCGNIPDGISVDGWKDITQIVCGWDNPFVAGLCSNGTVEITCTKELEESGFSADDIENWKNITHLSAGFDTLCGFVDGDYPNFVEVGSSSFNTIGNYHYCKIKDVRYGMTWLVITDENNIGAFGADGYLYEKYSDVLSVTGKNTMFILHSDGSVEARDEYTLFYSDHLSWKNIKQISSESSMEIYLAAIDADGNLFLNEAAKKAYGDICLTGAQSAYAGDNYLAVLMVDGTVNVYKTNEDDVK